MKIALFTCFRRDFNLKPKLAAAAHSNICLFMSLSINKNHNKGRKGGREGGEEGRRGGNMSKAIYVCDTPRIMFWLSMKL